MSEIFAACMAPTEATRQLGSALTSAAKDPLDVLRSMAWITSIKAPDGDPIVKYISDLKNYGVLELWAVPDVTIQKRAGDCEDISMLIAAMLAGLPDGLRPENVRVTVGRWGINPFATIGQALFPALPFPIEFHAWTEADVRGITYIIDGVGRFVGAAPHPAYKPIYSLYPDRIQMLRGWP